MLELQAENKKRLEVTVDSQVEEYRKLMEEARCLLSEEGNTTPQSIDLRIKTLARIDKIIGLENHDKKLDISSSDGSMTPPPSKIELVAPE